jgi:hypothetical protein
MELLIPGLILVALMVWASTKIKKTTAAAFEAETVETDEYIINKPQGFLHVLNGDPQYAFEAYSKEFGGPGAEDVRRATATVGVTATTVKEEASRRVNAGNNLIDDRSEVIGETKYRLIETRAVANDIAYRNLFKIAERGGKTYVMTVTVIAETTDEAMRDIETMLNSFELKV